MLTLLGSIKSANLSSLIDFKDGHDRLRPRRLLANQLLT
jgi:hypothetical protein